MSSRCDHEGTVEEIHLPQIAANTPPARTVWQCSACGMTWPESPRILAARHDGLRDAIVEGFPAEVRAREFADSIEITDSALPQLDDDQEGQVICRPDGESGGWEFWALRKSGLPPAEAAGFDAWARERAYLLALTNDPEVDGWFRRSDDGWQMTARRVEMPPDPFA